MALVQGSHGSGRAFAQARHRCLEASEHQPEEEARPSSGIVAAAGVVNQADEQRILLPGYFTTPGLHHTHPLQASLVGPGRRKIKSATVATVSPSICHEVMGPDAMILVF